MKKKYIFLISLILLFVIFGAFLASRQTGTINRPLPSPTPALSPTSTLPKAPLSVKELYPQQGTVELGNTQNAISLVFNQPIDVTTARISISPDLPIVVVARKDNGAGIIILPKNQWGANTTYIIRIAAGLESLSKEAALLQDVVLRYQMIVPPLPNYGTTEGAF